MASTNPPCYGARPMAKKRKPAGVTAFSDLKLRAKLREADELLEEGKLDAAMASLRRSARASDGCSRESLRRIIDLAAELEDFPLLEWAAVAFLERWPESPALTMMAAATCLQTVHPFRASALCDRVIDRWPGDAAATDARKLRDQLQRALPAATREPRLPQDDPEAGVLHEEVQNLLELARFSQCAAVARTLISRCPTFVPAHNNLCMALWALGDWAGALSATEQSLAMDPENVHALSNRVRCLAFLGRRDEAQAVASTLKTSKARGWIRKHKTMEGLAFAGMHHDIVELFDTPADSTAVDGDENMIRHYAAAACAMLGNTGRALELWRSVGRDPGPLVEGNLEDLRQAPGDRHGPWYFEINELLPPECLEALRHRASETPGKHVVGAVNEVLRQHPYLVSSVPMLLESGGPEATRLGVVLAAAARDPALAAAARRFVEGTRGTDLLRFEAHNLLSATGLVAPNERVEMFQRGQRKSIEFRSFEVHDQPDEHHQGQVARLHREGHEAMQARDFVRAEACFRRALESAPDAPDLAQNLGAALEKLGRKAEAHALLEDVHRRHPRLPVRTLRCGAASRAEGRHRRGRAAAEAGRHPAALPRHRAGSVRHRRGRAGDGARRPRRGAALGRDSPQGAIR